MAFVVGASWILGGAAALLTVAAVLRNKSKAARGWATIAVVAIGVAVVALVSLPIGD